MQIQELEEYLTIFLKLARQAAADLQKATAAEQYYEDATQDILHTSEFNPHMLENFDVISTLNLIRTERRDAKKELEGAILWKDWATENKKAFDKLDQLLGQLRKIIRRQNSAMYTFKTDIIAESGTFLDTTPSSNQSEDPTT